MFPGRVRQPLWPLLAALALLLAGCAPPQATPASAPSPLPVATPAPVMPATAVPAPATPAPMPPTPTATGGVRRVTLLLAAATGQVGVQAELALDPPQRAQGLMFRERLDDGEGMLFIFPADTTGGFWMQNTLVPLSIAFIDSTGAIVGLDDMAPLSQEIHQPPAPYRFALEVPRGFFARPGVQVGDKVLWRDAGQTRPLPALPAAAEAR